MASSLALTRLVSSNILPSPLRVATAPSTSRIFNTNSAARDDRDLNDIDVFDSVSPTRSLSQVLNMKVEGNRFLSTSRDIPGLGSKTRESNLRPLSPHLPIYKPQLSATLSITNRISGAFLATKFLFSYLISLKMGSIWFTYSNFYQFFFYSAKLAPVTVSIAALTVFYNLCYGVCHLLVDFSGKLKGKRMVAMATVIALVMLTFTAEAARPIEADGVIVITCSQPDCQNNCLKAYGSRLIRSACEKDPTVFGGTLCVCYHTAPADV
ncbi:hypothetical protein Gotur_033418 [Gossypium turneri]